MTATATPATPATPAPLRRRRPTGPHLGLLALVSLGLAVAGLVTSSLLPRVGATLLFGSAVPLGICAATAHARLHQLGVRVPGPSIGFSGGTTASLGLMASAGAGWVLARPGIGGDEPVARALADLAVLGGVVCAVGLGLLVAGVAVPALVLRLVPRWLAWVGLVVAAVCELGFLAMAVDPLQVLLPVGRYAGLLWLAGVGFLLPTRRRTTSGDRR